EVAVVLAARGLLGCRGDGRRLFLGGRSPGAGGLCARGLGMGGGGGQIAGGRPPADGGGFDRPLGGGSPQRVFRHLHRAHRIPLFTKASFAHVHPFASRTVLGTVPVRLHSTPCASELIRRTESTE